MPWCSVNWDSPENFKIKQTAETAGTAAEEALGADNYALFDSLSQVQIAALRQLYAQDSTEYGVALGQALDNYSFYVCFTDHPVDAIAAGQEAARLLNEIWPRTNEGHGYLLTGQWEQAKEAYLAVKDQYAEGLWQDFHAFAEKGIHHPDMAKAAELVLGRPLTTEEKALMEGK